MGIAPRTPDIHPSDSCVKWSMNLYGAQSDSLQSQFHNSIKWSVQYNRIVAGCPYAPLFRQVVPSAVIDGKPQSYFFSKPYSYSTWLAINLLPLSTLSSNYQKDELTRSNKLLY
ncbi:MAG: hypothetical protein QNJ49_16275 [Mastigocoleus sp. MO_167.B18]|nr:hypothetical protein [Mastigocoleus sp. MO_167.B18]